jgi:lipoate-protein ligase A
MRYIDLTLSTPHHNLALDEALLDSCEDGFHQEILRFWEPDEYFIVLGYSNRFHSEINLEACQKNHIPILRRSSGGGTVLQGSGCLNYSLILNIQNSHPLESITKTNSFIMNFHKETLKSLAGEKVKFQGTSDLTLDTLKFSGNAQRRKKNFLLFHGTFLLDFNISFIEKFLSMPSKQPEYRQGRSHRDFLTNLKLPSYILKDALRKSWNATEILQEIPIQKTEELVKKKYSRDEWNFKF